MKYLIFALLLFPFSAKADIEEITCLALNIYHEARSEPLEGQRAVAAVTLNRVQHSRFPNTVCRVVKQGKYKNGRLVKNQCQFSWWCDGKSDYPTEKETFYRIWNLASSMYETYRDNTGGALFYHADYVRPWWSRHKSKTKKIGQHVFYRYKKS